MRGRSEATSLLRCRAQIEHRTRDGRRIRRSRVRCHTANAEADNNRAPAHVATGCTIGRGRGPFSDPDLPQIETRLSRQTGPRSGRISPADDCCRWDATPALTDKDNDTDSHGVSDPSGQARDDFQRAYWGRSRHGSCSDRDVCTLAMDGTERRPYQEASTRSPRNDCGINQFWLYQARATHRPLRSARHRSPA